MELWIIITIAAAFFQNIRSTVQKYLKGHMGTTGATFVRFGFGIPFALIYWLVFYHYSGQVLPGIGEGFALWVTVAALAQIAATFMLLHLFSFRNFTVGTAYSRTEPAQTALFALVLFGEKLSVGGILAIAVSIAGVVLISVARTEITLRSMLSSIFSNTALIGLGSGTLFGLAAVGYRAAALSIEHELFFMRSATTLCFAIILQTLVMLVWIALREREELPRIARAWKPALLTGFVGATASFGWFTAFTLQQAALVKVVAQIEMLFTFATSIFFFKERINRPEVIGCILITAGIVLLVLWD
ncbi:MAG: DMT family transporter [Rhizobiaceae bacterium]